MNVLNCSSSKARRPLRSGISALSVIWLLACTSAGLWIMLSRKMPTPRVAAAPVAPQSASLVTQNAAIATSRYQPIDQIRVGQRVVTPGTEPGASLPTAVDPATWRLLTLRARNEWPDGTADAIEVQTLQPLAWLAAHHATVGSRVPIPLDLREMGVPSMSADVLAVGPCPPIEDGPGRVVLTTVNHLNSFLFDLKLNGARAPPQDLEVTGWHKLYSEDRQAWTSVCDLHAGEVLRGRDGPLTVASLARHPGVERVYNLTVEDEHQYYVSAADLLAHNANCVPVVEFSESRYPELADNIRNAQLAGHPDVLTYGGDVAINRPAALKDVPNISPLSRDEYPFASSMEGGEGSWVGHVPKGQQNAQGAILKNFYKKYNIQPGDQFRVAVVK